MSQKPPCCLERMGGPGSPCAGLSSGTCRGRLVAARQVVVKLARGDATGAVEPGGPITHCARTSRSVVEPVALTAAALVLHVSHPYPISLSHSHIAAHGIVDARRTLHLRAPNPEGRSQMTMRTARAQAQLLHRSTRMHCSVAVPTWIAEQSQAEDTRRCDDTPNLHAVGTPQFPSHLGPHRLTLGLVHCSR